MTSTQLVAVVSREDQEENMAATESPPDQLLEEGKKQLAAGNAAEAVESFQEACAVLAEKHGQVACELAEPYYLYGKSLLELARSQTTVLGTGIPVPDERGDSDNDEENSTTPSNGDTPGSSNTNEGAPGSSTANEHGDAPGSSAANENGDAPGSSAANENGNAPGSGTANENGDAPGISTANESQEEDESDLKLAWEILELARVICQKQSGEEHQLKLADVQLLLAEVGLESDQTEQAIADLNTALQIRELLLDNHDRRIAEVHFNLGLAHVLAKQPDQSIKHFNSAKEVLNKKKELLSKELEQSEVAEEKKKSLQDEVADIDSLLPDIESKISDTKEMAKLMEERENQPAEQQQDQESGFPAQQNDKKPVSDISHLVRKRVTEGEDTTATKKPRTETSNGSTVTAEQ